MGEIWKIGIVIVVEVWDFVGFLNLYDMCGLVFMDIKVEKSYISFMLVGSLVGWLVGEWRLFFLLDFVL